MSDLAQILEEELEEAVEVKNKKSLHRYIGLLTSQMAKKDENKMEHTEFQKELIKIDGRFNQQITEMREGFARMDIRFEAMDKRFDAVEKRFEAVDKRFEAVDKRFEAVDGKFNRQTVMMTIGFLVVTTLISVYKFIS